MKEKFFKKFVDVIEALLVQSQIFGLVTFNYTEKNFRLSKIRCCYNILAICLYTSMICYCVYRFVTLEEGPSIIYRTTDMIILITNGIYVVTIWVCSMTNSDEFIDFLVKLVDFDVKLQTSCIIINYRRNRKRIFFHMLARYFSLCLLIGFFLYISLTDSRHDIFADSMEYFLIVINSVMCHQTIEFVSMIKARFVILNRQITNLIDYFTKNNINTVDKTAELKSKSQFLALNKICALHHHLSKLIKLFNSTFGVVLLLMFGVSFVVIVICIFYCTGELQSSEIKWLKVLWALVGSLSFMIDTIYVCEVCYSTIEEAKKSGELIHKIDTPDHDIRDEIEMFSLQIANEQVEFNAAGFFPINYTLLFSIIGGVTTYIIILIQLSATLSD